MDFSDFFSFSLIDTVLVLQGVEWKQESAQSAKEKGEWKPRLDWHLLPRRTPLLFPVLVGGPCIGARAGLPRRLRELFGKFGGITSCTIKRDSESQKGQGFGFVTSRPRGSTEFLQVTMSSEDDND